MANEPAAPKRTQPAPSANGKSGKPKARPGPYDPTPGAAVKGKDRPAADSATAAEHRARRAERRPDLIKKRREELRNRPQKKKKEQLYTRLGFGVLAALLVVAIGFYGYTSLKDRDLNQIPDGVQTYEYSGGQHDDAFNAWTEVPPAGGKHNNIWQQCGFYDGQIGSGYGVHSMEHGAVWLTYSPDLPQDQIDELKKIAESKDYILVSEFPGLPAPIVASSWNHQLQLQSASDKKLDQFIRVFRKNAKYAPEPGASCSGGNTTTIA